MNQSSPNSSVKSYSYTESSELRDHKKKTNVSWSNELEVVEFLKTSRISRLQEFRVPRKESFYWHLERPVGTDIVPNYRLQTTKSQYVD